MLRAQDRSNGASLPLHHAATDCWLRPDRQRGETGKSVPGMQEHLRMRISRAALLMGEEVPEIRVPGSGHEGRGWGWEEIRDSFVSSAETSCASVKSRKDTPNQTSAVRRL